MMCNQYLFGTPKNMNPNLYLGNYIIPNNYKVINPVNNNLLYQQGYTQIKPYQYINLMNNTNMHTPFINRQNKKINYSLKKNAVIIPQKNYPKVISPPQYGNMNIIDPNANFNINKIPPNEYHLSAKKKRPNELILNINPSNGNSLQDINYGKETQSVNVSLNSIKTQNLKYSSNKKERPSIYNNNQKVKLYSSNKTLLTSADRLFNKMVPDTFETIKNFPEDKDSDINDNNNIFENRPSTITINLDDNNSLQISYITNSKKKSISSNEITSSLKRKNLIQKKNSFLKVANFDKSINNINNIKKLGLKYDEYFTKYMFEQINNIRTNPKSFIKKIEKEKINISKDKRGNSIYKGKLKVALTKGKEAFNEAISSLKKIKPMKPLIFNKKLCVEISKNENEFKSGDYLRKKIIELINNGVKIKAFWRDIIKDPEINFLLMIIDDNPIKPGEKRKDILNNKMKYIGINAAYLGNDFVCYLVLCDK